MRKHLALFVTVFVLLVMAGVIAANAGGSKTVRTLGDVVLKPNVRVFSNLRFSPGPTVISSGDTVFWMHSDDTEDPHTVTLASPDQLVQDFGDFIGGECPACEAAAGAALGGHFGTFPPTIVLDPDQDGQFSSPGDSLLFFPGETVSAQINVPAGTTLNYFCAIHPWMQGTIEVK
ncbi:MAG TPA: hypothetical protein VGA03_04980 [Anaerolineales bacterium]